VRIDVHALQASALTRLPGQIVLEVVGDRMAAQDHVAELMAAEAPGGGHDPTHAERRADRFRLVAARDSRADYFLERDDIGIDGAQHRDDPIRPRAAIHALTPMDVVGDDSQARGGVSH
jgi:hypothetical protein